MLENLQQTTQLVNSDRRIHIGDRESDIYELLCLAQEEQTHFLVRTCVDRLAGAGRTTIAPKMQREPIQVKLQLQFSQMTVHPPILKHKKNQPCH